MGTSLLKKLLIVFLIVAGLYFAREFLMPVAIAAILAALFRPLCEWLEKRKFPRLLTPFICILLIFLFIGGVFTLLGWQIASLAEDAARIQQRATELLGSLQQYVYDRVGIDKDEQLRILKEQQSMVSGFISSLAGSLMAVFTGGVLTLVYMFLFLYYRNHLLQFVVKLAPPQQKENARQVVTQAADVAQQYLLGLAKMIGCLWIMYSIGFSIVGVPNAIFFAILCGLLEIVPIIGNLTGTSLTLLVSAAQGATSGMLIGIVVVYLIVQFIQGWVLEAIIVGPHVKINPLFTILALVLGELIWGIPGIVLAIPGIAVIKIICDHVEPLKPYGFLFGEVGTKTENKWMKKIRGWFRR